MVVSVAVRRGAARSGDGDDHFTGYDSNPNDFASGGTGWDLAGVHHNGRMRVTAGAAALIWPYLQAPLSGVASISTTGPAGRCCCSPPDG